ncbi:hypothetical protein [Altererythrobacter sp. Z27]|uniref:hypothetical protein n=1 Tax=Altererythrobacter sp. Z27 TaxID=3461147 RepID=UPI004043E571
MSGIANTETTPTARAEVLAARWQALHAAGQEIGTMAALAPEPFDSGLEGFPARIEARGGARLVLASDGIADLDAILQPGLIALRTILARGQDTTAPALALWREFHALRTALLSLAPETEVETEAETANPPVAA